MPHKACFRCNLLFEAAAVHIGVAVPCPNCGRTLEDYQVTEETPLEAPIGATTMAAATGQIPTTMFRLPAASRKGRTTDPLAGRRGVDENIDDDDLFTSASEGLEEAPTRALDVRALQSAQGARASLADGRPRADLFDSEGPTRALDARKLAAGLPADVDEDAPTRALDAQKLRQAALLAPVEVAGPAPPGGVQGVSGPVPKRRARPPEPPPPSPEPVPPRRHRPAEPEAARGEGRASAAADIPRPPARPSPAPRPMARASVGSAGEPRPRAEAPPPPRGEPVRAERPAVRGRPLPEVPPFFEDSQAIDVPDALGSLIARQQVPRESARATPPIARATQVPRRPRPARPPIFYVLVAACLGLLAGAILLVVTRDTELTRVASPGQAVVTEAAPPWQDQLTQALDRAQVRVPEGEQGEALTAADFLVASPDGVATQRGPVVGLLATPIPDDQVDPDEGGEAVRPLLGALSQPEGDRLTLGLDRGVSARTTARLLYTAWRAGYRRIGLLTRRASGELVALEVAPFRPGTPLPAAGGLVLRVGQLAVSAVVEGRDGRVVGERPMPVPLGPGGAVDFPALDRVLDSLASDHPRVRDAVVYVNGDLPMEVLVGVLGRVRGSPQRDRFVSIALSVQ